MTISSREQKEQERNRLADAEEIFGYSPCMHCEHYDRTDTPGNKCKLAPEESIPEEAFFGKWLCIAFTDIDS
jgi:hypothetical protein